jgi:2-amino-4-hydroxy-6-hydroxymethyldihydropteridine diphosphokinase
MQIFLALGSNLGDREAALVETRDQLMKQGVMVMRQSAVLEMEPVYAEGYEGARDQGAYLNQVLECETELLPVDLLRVCKEIEEEMGRDMSEKGTGAARIIDVDILLYGEEKIVMPGLTIPHPELKKRDFWIVGMEELAGK